MLKTTYSRLTLAGENFCQNNAFPETTPRDQIILELISDLYYDDALADCAELTPKDIGIGHTFAMTESLDTAITGSCYKQMDKGSSIFDPRITVPAKEHLSIKMGLFGMQCTDGDNSLASPLQLVHQSTQTVSFETNILDSLAGVDAGSLNMVVPFNFGYSYTFEVSSTSEKCLKTSFSLGVESEISTEVPKCALAGAKCTGSITGSKSSSGNTESCNYSQADSEFSGIVGEYSLLIKFQAASDASSAACEDYEAVHSSCTFHNQPASEYIKAEGGMAENCGICCVNDCTSSASILSFGILLGALTVDMII